VGNTEAVLFRYAISVGVTGRSNSVLYPSWPRQRPKETDTTACSTRRSSNAMPGAGRQRYVTVSRSRAYASQFRSRQPSPDTPPRQETANPQIPSQTRKNTSLIPRLRRSVNTLIQNLAPSPPEPAHNPSTSLFPSRVTPIAA